jgi:hypothetical protein
MKSVEFEEQTHKIAEHQEQYETLHAHVQPNGILTHCMELEPEEVLKVFKNREIKLTVINSFYPVQSLAVSTVKPTFPVSNQIMVNARPISYQKTEMQISKDETGEVETATFHFTINRIEAANVRESNKIWITVITHGAHLQPISLAT